MSGSISIQTQPAPRGFSSAGEKRKKKSVIKFARGLCGAAPSARRTTGSVSQPTSLHRDHWLWSTTQHGVFFLLKHRIKRLGVIFILYRSFWAKYISCHLRAALTEYLKKTIKTPDWAKNTHLPVVNVWFLSVYRSHSWETQRCYCYHIV